MPVSSTQDIRAHFPALRRKHDGYPTAYFDGPGGTQVPSVVVDAMVDYMLYHNANTHWAYPTSHETDEALLAAREALADFLHADASEIVFGANMTTLTFHLARALGRGYEPGDEIVVTELDHHANVAPWTALEQDRGVTVRTAKLVPETGRLDWSHLESLLNDRTRMLAIGAASNALGTINDVDRAVRLAHDAGALVTVDAVHFAPHALVDVQALGCDFLLCSPYKFYGPHTGVLYGRRDILQSVDFPKLLPAPDTVPERAETGTLNHEGIVGAAAAVHFLASLAQGDSRRDRLEKTFDALHARGQRLLGQLWEGLRAIERVRVYGPPPEARRTPTIAFTVAGRSAREVSQSLAARGIFVSHGDFYAATVVERLAVEGLVRAGCACYTTTEEVQRLVDCVRAVARDAHPSSAGTGAR